MESWDVVERYDEIKDIDSTWEFNLKLFPDGLINKLKSWFCARSDQQWEGVDLFETYYHVM